MKTWLWSTSPRTEACAGWFTLRDLSVGELWQMKMESNVEYIAMMSNIEL